jgi:cobyrinic acid a,c-diamide synthase
MTRGFIITGTNSGSGKTTVTLGLMAALQDRGLSVQPFKCGPDFIDPGLHQLITGKVSRNLDLWMMGEEFTKTTFANHLQPQDVSVIEGVMGMYDGAHSSSGALAGALNLVPILVLDVRSMAESSAAIVKGFEVYNPATAPKGVILNRVASERHLQLVRDAIETHCQAEVLGYLPRTLEFTIPSRHLGLLTGDESPLSPQAVAQLSRTVSDHINLDRLLAISSTYPSVAPAQQPVRHQMPATPSCRIGVARDKAFCFYYQDNLDLLTQAGAELVYFSPLRDNTLPNDLNGIYLGGGYPELYGRQLAENASMLREIRNWTENGGATYAECGGFMYLTRGITDHEHNFYPMVGFFPVTARMQNTRASLGYRQVRTNRSSCFGPAGTILRGHEFHYSTIGSMPEEVPRIYELDNSSQEGYCLHRSLGGYMHLHFGYAPQVARNFVNFCRES